MDRVTQQLKSYYDVEMTRRRSRPLPADRAEKLAGFITEARRRGVRSVLEVGCGAGRDGIRIAEAGFAYAGADLSTTAVRICGELGLAGVEASAVALPFADASFDAAWSMSTLMHLPEDGLTRAMAELRRVVRPGGLVEIGVWGHEPGRPFVGEDGRFFNQRSDDELSRELTRLGTIEDFATWAHGDAFGHYQWARVRVGGGEPARGPGTTHG